MPERKLGTDWRHLASCASTNDELLRLGKEGAPEGTVVTASAQTGGRGRLGRKWFSPPDENLYLSVLLRPPLTPPQAPMLCLCAGLALHQAVGKLSGDMEGNRLPRLRLKWPNDLLAAPSDSDDAVFRKLGGILTELVCVGADVDFVVVGVGCNVRSTTFPDTLEATSLALLGIDTKDTDFLRKLGENLLVSLEDFYALYLREGESRILGAFNSAAPFSPAPLAAEREGASFSRF